MSDRNPKPGPEPSVMMSQDAMARALLMMRNPAFDPPELPADRWYPPAEAKPGEIMARRAKYVEEAIALHQELDILIEFGLGRKDVQYHIDLLENIKRYLKEVNFLAWTSTSGFAPDEAKKLQQEYSDASNTFSNSRAGALADELSCSQICDLHQQNFAQGLCACPKPAIQQASSQASSTANGSDQPVPQATPMKKVMAKQGSFPSYRTPDSIKQQDYSQSSLELSSMSPQPSPSLSIAMNASTQSANGIVATTVELQAAAQEQIMRSAMNKKQPLKKVPDMTLLHSTPSKASIAQQRQENSPVTTPVSQDADLASLQNSVPGLPSPSGFAPGKRKRNIVADREAPAAEAPRKKARRTAGAKSTPALSQSEVPPSPHPAVNSDSQHQSGRAPVINQQAGSQPVTQHNTPDFLNQYITSFQGVFNSPVQQPRLSHDMNSLDAALSQRRVSAQGNQSQMLPSTTMVPPMRVLSSMAPTNAGKTHQGTPNLPSQNYLSNMMTKPNDLGLPPFQNPLPRQGMHGPMGFVGSLPTPNPNTTVGFTSDFFNPEPWSNNTPLVIVTSDGEMISVNGMRNLSHGQVIDVANGRIYGFYDFLDLFDQRRAAQGLSVSLRNR